ncbi:MAG TPA: hypothetical protein VLG44_02235, partial [Chlamydiales bacterium]|nr:hypothetical protein [Chlamydiales bacterium]
PSLLEAEMTMEHLKPIHEKKLDQLKKELADLDLPEANNVMKAFDVLYEAIVNKINIPSGELKSAAPDDEQSVIEDKQEIQNAIEELERYGQSLMEWHEHDKRDLLLITVKDFKPPLPIAVYASAREGRPVLMRQGNSYKVYDQIEDFQWDLKDLDESMTPLLAKLPFPNKAGEAKVLKGSDKSFSQKIVDKLQPLLFNYPINSDSYRKGRDIVVTCEKLKSRLLNPIFNIAALDKDFEKIISQNKTLDSFRRFSAKHIAANILFAPIGFILQIANLCRNGRLDIYFNSLSVPLLFNAKTTRREKSDHILGTVRKIQGKKGVAHKKEDVQEMKGDIEEEVKGESPGRKGPKKPD